MGNGWLGNPGCAAKGCNPCQGGPWNRKVSRFKSLLLGSFGPCPGIVRYFLGDFFLVNFGYENCWDVDLYLGCVIIYIYHIIWYWIPLYYTIFTISFIPFILYIYIISYTIFQVPYRLSCVPFGLEKTNRQLMGAKLFQRDCDCEGCAYLPIPSLNPGRVREKKSLRFSMVVSGSPNRW